MTIIIGWVLAVGIPALLAWGIVADARAEAAHDRYMESERQRLLEMVGGVR